MKSLNVLLIGSGGREHALAEAIAQSPQLGSLAVAPGNAGTARFNTDLDGTDFEAVVSYCKENSVDLVVVGPEAPLVDGIADALAAADIACFGPSAAAARLEGSKSFARAFAQRHGIPGPRCQSFTEVEAAQAWAHQMGAPVVVKADGLASGKGVIVPETKVETERAIFDLLAEKTRSARPEQRLCSKNASSAKRFRCSGSPMVPKLSCSEPHKTTSALAMETPG